MKEKVCKFGGTSLADRVQIDKAIDILVADPTRKYVVVSAPGKRSSDDKKITDLLIESETNIGAANRVIQRFAEILPEKPEIIGNLLHDLGTRGKGSLDGIKAFGEYASAVVVSEIMKIRGIDAVFLDPRDIGFMALNGEMGARPDSACFSEMGKHLANLSEGKIIVIPGFYAYDSSGKIVTFPRGGSDTSGAVIANAVEAIVYENWTDEDGLRRADPRIVRDAGVIGEMTYREARELAYMGFKLQDESFLPLINKRIPLNVRNTNNPHSSGTNVVSDRIVPAEEVIVGVAVKKGYHTVNLSKMLMNAEIGFGEKVFSVLREMGMPYEHCPTGIDTMSLTIDRNYLAGEKLNSLTRRLNEVAGPMDIHIGEPMALVAVAGLGMQRCADADIKILSALNNAGIRRRMLNEGAKDLSFFIGVDEKDADSAVKAIYHEFYK